MVMEINKIPGVKVKVRRMARGLYVFKVRVGNIEFMSAQASL